MRPIKFRARRSDTKEWCYFTLGDLVCCSSSTIGKGFDWENWCEFTGLHDKNGKEIYEGDILKAFDDYRSIVRVQWEFGSWQVEGGGLLDNLKQNVQVIGNIHENPELLK